MHSRRRFISTSVAMAALALRPPMAGFAEDDKPRAVNSVADFGALPGAKDCTEAVRAAIAHLPKTGGTLLFPAGDYVFAITSGIAMRLTNLAGLTLEGNGSRLYFAGDAKPLTIENCPELKLRNFTIDWKRPPFSQGEVVSLGTDQQSVCVRLDPGFELSGGEPIGAFSTYDRRDKLPARDGLDVYGSVSSTAILRDKTLLINFTRQINGLIPGSTLIMRHEVYGNGAITLVGCTGVHIENLTIHTCPGMGIKAARCTDIALESVKIVPRPESGAMMSTTADAIHFRRCSGSVSMSNCTIWGMGDDGVNIHGDYFRLVTQSSPNTATFFRWPPNIAVGVGDLPQLGTKTRFLSDALLPLGESEVRSSQAGPTMTLEFDREIPKGASPGSLISFAEDDSRFHVDHCKFLGNRARAILAHNQTLIENCTFSGQTMAALLFEADTHWLEGPLARQVIVRNSTIENVDRVKRAKGDITIDTSLERVAGRPSEKAGGFLNTDIEISGNTFRNSRTAAIALGSVQNVQIEHNSFASRSGCAISIRSAKAVSIVGNECTPAADVRVDTGSMAGVDFKQNSGFTIQQSKIV